MTLYSPRQTTALANPLRRAADIDFTRGRRLVTRGGATWCTILSVNR